MPSGFETAVNKPLFGKQNFADVHLGIEVRDQPRLKPDFANNVLCDQETRINKFVLIKTKNSQGHQIMRIGEWE